MTRPAVIDSITEWHELLSFCYEHNLRSCDDVRRGADILDEMDNEVAEYIRYHNWRDLRDMLIDMDIDEDYYYAINGLLDYEELNDWRDFEEYKSYVLEEMNEAWDDDDEEDDLGEWLYEGDESANDEFDVADETEIGCVFGFDGPVIMSVECAKKAKRTVGNAVPEIM